MRFRSPHRRDEAHTAIVRALRRVGCSVLDLSSVGKGCPDILARSPDGFIVFIEVKSPRGRLTAEQERFAVYWPETQTAVTVEDALRIVGVHSERKSHDANT